MAVKTVHVLCCVEYLAFSPELFCYASSGASGLKCEYLGTEGNCVLCCLADDLLSLSLDVMPRCVGHLLTRDVSRPDKVVQIVETLMMNGAVLVPYPCSYTVTVTEFHSSTELE